MADTTGLKMEVRSFVSRLASPRTRDEGLDAKGTWYWRMQSFLRRVKDATRHPMYADTGVKRRGINANGRLRSIVTGYSDQLTKGSTREQIVKTFEDVIQLLVEEMVALEEQLIEAKKEATERTAYADQQFRAFKIADNARQRWLDEAARYYRHREAILDAMVDNSDAGDRPVPPLLYQPPPQQHWLQNETNDGGVALA